MTNKPPAGAFIFRVHIGAYMVEHFKVAGFR